MFSNFFSPTISPCRSKLYEMLQPLSHTVLKCPRTTKMVLNAGSLLLSNITEDPVGGLCPSTRPPAHTWVSYTILENSIDSFRLIQKVLLCPVAPPYPLQNLSSVRLGNVDFSPPWILLIFVIELYDLDLTIDLLPPLFSLPLFSHCAAHTTFYSLPASAS